MSLPTFILLCAALSSLSVEALNEGCILPWIDLWLVENRPLKLIKNKRHSRFQWRDIVHGELDGRILSIFDFMYYRT